MFKIASHFIQFIYKQQYSPQNQPRHLEMRLQSRGGLEHRQLTASLPRRRQRRVIYKRSVVHAREEELFPSLTGDLIATAVPRVKGDERRWIAAKCSVATVFAQKAEKRKEQKAEKTMRLAPRRCCAPREACGCVGDAAAVRSL